MAPMLMLMPAAAVELRPPELPPELETGVDCGSWSVVLGFSGLFRG